MVIDDLNLMRIARPPEETDAPLTIDADAVLSRSIAFQCFETVRRRNSQRFQGSSGSKHFQFSCGDPLDILWQLAREPAVEQSLGFPTSKALNHGGMLT